MSESHRCHDFPALAADGGVGRFDHQNVLWALEWAAVAPGIGGWNVLLDDIAPTRLMSIIPPASREASFIIYRKNGGVVASWVPPDSVGRSVEMKRFDDLRTALLSLCSLDRETLRQVDESVELLCSGRLRRQ